MTAARTRRRTSHDAGLLKKLVTNRVGQKTSAEIQSSRRIIEFWC
jgi:hypothetical protein